MSVSMTRADGVTVFTLTSDPKSSCPPLCQIMKGLCYSPVCCSVSQHLRVVQRHSQTLLGTLQIMVGLLNIGLGAILCSTPSGSWWQMDFTKFPFWLAALFILFGALCILSERFPSPCLVILNVILNLAGVGFAIAAIVLYSINIAYIRIWNMCTKDDYWYRRNWVTPMPSLSPDEKILMDLCLEGKALILMLLRGINGVLIVLSVLQLCLAISATVLGIKALRSRSQAEKKSAEDPETYKPLLDGDAKA